MPFKVLRRIGGVLVVGISLGAVGAPAQQAVDAPSHLLSVELPLRPGIPLDMTVPAPSELRLRSFLISVADPGQIAQGSSIEVRVGPASKPATVDAVASKILHVGDPDVLWSILQPKDVAFTVKITKLPAVDPDGSAVKPLRVAVRVAELDRATTAVQGLVADAAVVDHIAFEAEPNDQPEQANTLNLGETVYGLADDRPYLPLGTELTEKERTAGADWFRFTFGGDVPQLAFFGLDFVDRDVPPDLRIYRKDNGQLVEYTRGIDPQSLQRERPPRQGANKFTTRVLTKGTYYLWVDACQPDYQLRTKLFDVPPYLKSEQAEKVDPAAITAAARRAIRTAMDFQLLAGESWHANTPRKGHPMDRVANVHHETSTCIACHPTHFTTQSAMAAVKAGYGIEQPFALEFLTERLANNPVPFHGHPD
ncbi:MAG TPA: hypothetical protein VHS97_16820, partial [Isosphaeraceae bacterium]|nr:hypothetical protein [Isosphaeraceae bacterium]